MLVGRRPVSQPYLAYLLRLWQVQGTGKAGTVEVTEDIEYIMPLQSGVPAQ
jgi:hypothetical protein